MAANGFTLAFPRRIVFGWEALRDAPREILRCGRRVLLLATRSCGVAAERLEAALRREGADVLRADGPGREPEVADVDRLAAEARARRSEVVVGLADIARRHGLVLCADEIYDKVLYDNAVHTLAAAVAPDVLTLTFNGLSKAYRVAGYRAGWLAISGPVDRATDYLSGIDMLANMRLCANVPAQHVIQTALGGRQSIAELVAPGGRLAEQRDVAYGLLNAIPGVSCTKPQGALYLFPRIDTKMYDIESDEQFVLDFLRAEKVLLVHGTGFNLPTPDHFRIVTLPRVDTLTEALGRLE